MTKILDIKEVIMWKDQNSFAKGYNPIWSKELLIITEVKILCHGYTLLLIKTVKKLSECSMEKSGKQQIRENIESKTW